jgi:hypothetical protein
MKMLLGFFIGTTVALLLVLIIMRTTSPVSADEDSTPASTPTDTPSIDPVGLSGLMPDVEHIYRVALGDPYRQVQKEINDPDIANYFHQYLEDTGLDKVD